MALRRRRRDQAARFARAPEELETLINEVEIEDLGSKKMKLKFPNGRLVEADYAGAQFYGRGDLGKDPSRHEDLVGIVKANDSFFDDLADRVMEGALNP